MKKENIIVLAVVSWIFVVFAVFSIFIVYESDKKERVYASEVSNELPCSNLTLINTAECLREEQGKWWKYNISNLDLYWNKVYGELQDVNWSVIKEQGGVCSHSSLNYIEEAEKLGFKGREIKFRGDDKIGHEIALIFSKDLSSYCLLDQQSKVKCQRLNSGEIKDET